MFVKIITTIQAILAMYYDYFNSIDEIEDCDKQSLVLH